MKKEMMLLAVGIALIIALAPSVVLAGPSHPPDYGTYNPTGLPNQPPEEWGVEKVIPSPSAPGGAVRIITDPLVGIPWASGWVTFHCQSRLGFEYNIGAAGLSPLSRYSVRAEGVGFQFSLEAVPGAIEVEPGLWILPWTATPVALDLGTFMADANGLGGVRGVAKLSAGYAYDVHTLVFASDGSPVLWSPADDTNGFIVY